MEKVQKIIIALLVCVVCIVPSGVYAASFSFKNSSGAYHVGDRISVGVYVNSAGTSINAVSGRVSFPTEYLDVVSLSKDGSIFSLWVQEPTFSNAQGTVDFEGVILNPGYTGSSGRIIIVTFRVKQEGTALLRVVKGSILANDGAATDVLSGLAEHSLMFAPVEPAPKKEVTTPDKKETPVAPTKAATTTTEVPVFATTTPIQFASSTNKHQAPTKESSSEERYPLTNIIVYVGSALFVLNFYAMYRLLRLARRAGTIEHKRPVPRTFKKRIERHLDAIRDARHKRVLTREELEILEDFEE